MSVHAGSNDIGGIHLGDKKIVSAYLGDKKIFDYSHQPLPTGSITPEDILAEEEFYVPTTNKIGYDMSNCKKADVWTDGTDTYYSYFDRYSEKFLGVLNGAIWYENEWNHPVLGREVWYDNNNIYHSSYIFDKVNKTWNDKVWHGIFYIPVAQVWTDGVDTYISDDILVDNRYVSYQYIYNSTLDKWEKKEWNREGYIYDSSIQGKNIWTDGTTMYLTSSGTNGYLDKTTNTWREKDWGSWSPIDANRIWTDGTNIYHSSDETYILNTSTGKWSRKNFSGYNHIDGEYVWSDGVNVYYSSYHAAHNYIFDPTNNTWSITHIYDQSGSEWLPNNPRQMVWTYNNNVYSDSTNVLNKNTNTWETISWYDASGNRISFSGASVWKCGSDIFIGRKYVLNQTNNTWVEKIWDGEGAYVPGERVWTDGVDIYYAGNDNFKDSRILDRSTDTWRLIDINVPSNMFYSFIIPKDGVWTDGVNTYYNASGGLSFIFDRSTKTWNTKTWDGDYAPADGRGIWTDGTNIYYSYGTNQYVYDRINGVWNLKSWNYYPSDLLGCKIWSDGTDYYFGNYKLDNTNNTWIQYQGFKRYSMPEDIEYSGGSVWSDSNQTFIITDLSIYSNYALDRIKNIWIKKNWSVHGASNDSSVWTDGEDLYLSNRTSNYIYNSNTDAWTTITFGDKQPRSTGSDVWTDGVNIYYDYNSYHYVFDKVNKVWNDNVWNYDSGISTSISNGKSVWTDGVNIYYNYGNTTSYSLILDTTNNTWKKMDWIIPTNYMLGVNIWHSNGNTYHTHSGVTYMLVPNSNVWRLKNFNNNLNFNGNKIWNYGNKTYLLLSGKNYLITP